MALWQKGLLCIFAGIVAGNVLRDSHSSGADQIGRAIAIGLFWLFGIALIVLHFFRRAGSTLAVSADGASPSDQAPKKPVSGRLILISLIVGGAVGLAGAWITNKNKPNPPNRSMASEVK